GWEGRFDFPWLRLINDQDAWLSAEITSEPINPLYTGTHVVGPYAANAVAPSGASTQLILDGLRPSPNSGYAYDLSFTPGQAVAVCSAAVGGGEAAPAAAAPTGWWTDTLCGYGHAAWTSFSARAGRTATVEITALDEQGLAATTKAMPLVGLWNLSDAVGTLPTVAYTPAAFNTMALGTTALKVAGTQAAGFRMAFTDARGDGRPDFSYRARILYADSVAPAVTTQGGGLISIRGMGFRSGVRVLVNGVVATVLGVTANTIAAVAPPLSAFGSLPAGAVDIEVRDTQTGGSTTISSALQYTSVPGYVLRLVSAPSGTVQSGVSAGAFSVRLLLNDGVTPVPGMPVIFSVTGSGGLLTGCTGSPCTALTNSTGLASVTVTPVGFGSVTLTASAMGSVQSASFTAVSRSIAAEQPVLYVMAGVQFGWSTQARLTENGAAAAGAAVSWTGSAGISFSSPDGLASTAGVVQNTATVAPLAAGAAASSEACGWSSPGLPGLCVSFSATGVDPKELSLHLVSGGGQAIGLNGTFAPVVVQVVDTAGHPVAGTPVQVHQTVDQAQMPCPTQGACPIPVALGSSTETLVSDAGGMLSLRPMQVPGMGEITHLALACGAAGFLSLSLTQGP
nr:IPT/TIG domain-containing protein [Acidobacteriota bacterium]